MPLFKYVPTERVDVLRTKRICFSRPSALNDIFEMQPVFMRFGTVEAVKALVDPQWQKVLDQTIEEGYVRRGLSEHSGITLEQAKAAARSMMPIGQVVDHVDRAVEATKPEISARLLAELDREVGVLSLSEAPDSLLMWAHYARRHEGFLIEMNPEHQFFHQPTASEEFGKIMQVEYGARPKPVMIDATVRDLLFTKSTDWSYEREWRMALLLDRAATVTEHGHHLVPIDPTCISGVTLGCRMSSDARTVVVTALRSDPSFQHVRLREAIQAEHEYRVDFRDLPAY
jgi:hypothetical protein